jgi:type III secretory pathway component EscR
VRYALRAPPDSPNRGCYAAYPRLGSPLSSTLYVSMKSPAKIILNICAVILGLFLMAMLSMAGLEKAELIFVFIALLAIYPLYLIVRIFIAAPIKKKAMDKQFEKALESRRKILLENNLQEELVQHEKLVKKLGE